LNISDRKKRQNKYAGDINTWSLPPFSFLFEVGCDYLTIDLCAFLEVSDLKRAFIIRPPFGVNFTFHFLDACFWGKLLIIVEKLIIIINIQKSSTP
jgi:hypothetical protein